MLRVLHSDWASQVALVINSHQPVKETCDSGLISGLGWFPGGGNDNPLQYSCPENPMDRRTWQVTVHRVAKSWTQLSNLASANGWTLHTLGNYHCDKSTNNLVFNKVVTTLLTIFFMLVSYFHDFLLGNWRFIPLNSLHLFHFPYSLPSGNHLFFLYESVFMFFNFFMDSTYQWDHTVFVFLCFWLILFNVISTPLSTHVVTNGKASFSMARWSSTIYIYIPPRFLYPFNYWYVVYFGGAHFGSLVTVIPSNIFQPFSLSAFFLGLLLFICWCTWNFLMGLWGFVHIYSVSLPL